MQKVRSVLSRFRGALIYTSICAFILLLSYNRAWNHVATLNGDEWGSIQAFVRANRHPPEPVCFLPSWTVGHATDQRKFRGIEVIENPSDAWEGRDEALSGLWVVSQFGAFEPSSVPDEVYPHRAHIQIAGADVYVFRHEPVEFESSLYLRVQEARCELTGPGGLRQPLIWSRTGYIVPHNFPNRRRFGYLGCRPTEGRFAGQAHAGIWFHPPPERHRLKMTWPQIELEKRWLAVSGGLRDQIARRKAPPIDLAVSLDGKQLRRLSFPARRGWSTFAVDLGPEAGPGRRGDLSFEVWTKRNHSRHFIFDARFEETRPAEKSLGSPRRGRRGAARRAQEARSRDDDNRDIEDEQRLNDEREGRSRESSSPIESDGGDAESNETGEEG